MPHWDHAYARTLHSLRGTTAERFMLYAEANNRFGVGGKVSDAVLEQIFGARGFYVGINRQRKALTIYTNDREVLGAPIQKEREKTSALEGMGEVPRMQRQSFEPQTTSRQRVRVGAEDSRALLDRRTTTEPTIESTLTQDPHRRFLVRPRWR